MILDGGRPDQQSQSVSIWRASVLLSYQQELKSKEGIPEIKAIHYIVIC